MTRDPEWRLIPFVEYRSAKGRLLSVLAVLHVSGQLLPDPFYARYVDSFLSMNLMVYKPNVYRSGPSCIPGWPYWRTVLRGIFWLTMILSGLHQVPPLKNPSTPDKE